MRKRLCQLAVVIMAMFGCLPIFATTVTVNSGQSTATIQGAINGTVAGDTVSFSAGTYSITTGLTLKCGVTYTGPVATPSTVILASTFGQSSAIFSLFAGSGFSNPCTQATIIEYLNFKNSGGIYVQTSFTNLTIVHNQFSNIPCCNSPNFFPIAGTIGIYFDGAQSTSNSAQTLSNTLVQWNTIGDSASCLLPQSTFADNSSPEGDGAAGACNGIIVATSVNGLTIKNNNFVHLSEGTHITCPGGGHPGTTQPCEPTSNGVTTKNVDIEFNDYFQIKRINHEEQPQTITNVTFASNSIHDMLAPTAFSFGLSFACCGGGATPPYLNSSSNVVILNTPPAGRYGYGDEAWGKNANYDHNFMESGAGATSIGMAYSFGPVATMNFNKVCGGGFAAAGYIASEGNGTGIIPPAQTGNVTSATCSAAASVAPSISPAQGAYASPLTVTLTDPGYTSGAFPLGNTSIYYTTDGSTPNPSGVSTAAQYFISTSGNDSNPGTLASPWLSPNHAVNCGDTITAAAGTYSSSNFQNGDWGTVTCSGANNVAWLKCATFDACKITATGSDGMWVDQSYWGVQGWEITTNTTQVGACFHAGPSGGSTIHHIIFANNVANGCMGGGFNAYDLSTSASVDYIAYVGNVAYNATRGTGACYSGLNIYQPIASDTVAGTHMFVAGNYSWANVDAPSCDSAGAGKTTDGEGINFDTFDFSQGGGPVYTQQAVVQNNIEGFNGTRGIEVENSAAGSTHAPIFIKFNTMYNSGTDPNMAFPAGIAELGIFNALNVAATNNLVYTGHQFTTGTNAFFALGMANGDGTDVVTSNYASGVAGNNTYLQTSSGFSYGGANVLGTNPAFANPVNPGAPACSGKANVPACMATFIANLTPTVTAAKAYGYQAPVSTPVTDSLFPQWLCNVGLPVGLVTSPCVAGNTTQLYTVPIAVSLPATVKAVGMWGAANQPKSYPSGYGFVPSSVTTTNYSTSGGVTLSGVSIASTGGVTTLSVGSTVQMIVTCQYSDGSTSGCNTTDSHGNSVTSWASSSGNVTVSSTGVATGAVIGTAVITATVTGGFTTSPGVTLTVTGTALTLSSVSLATAGGVSSITAGSTNQLIDTCHYSDGSTTSCSTVDSHGNVASAHNSSSPTIASVSSSGLATGVAAGTTNLTGTVNPAPSMLGQNNFSLAGTGTTGFINESYSITGTSAGNYQPGTCNIYMPPTSWTAGSLWTCIIVLAPTPTTQNASALCSASYTTTGTSWPGGWLPPISMASCPALAANQGYWIGSTTNLPQSNPAQGFWQCSGGCNGGVPTFGAGTYPYRYAANAFGNYTNLPTTLTSDGAIQVAQYVTLTTTPVTSANLPLSVTGAPPSLVSAYLTGTASIVVPNTSQLAAKCHYTSGADQDCTVADIYGDAVSMWASSDPTKATVGNVGSASPGLVTAVAAGTSSMTATIGPSGIISTAYPVTITNAAVTLTGVSLSTAGGVTGLFVGSTNQLKAICTYSDMSSLDCTNTDAHGNKANTYLSTTPSHATIGSTTGLVSGVAPGTTTFTAHAGSFTSSALPLTVLSVPSGIYTITVRGPIGFSGTVRF